ncbi:HEAT repeat domain-containing protein [Halobacterium sp. CBA1126]|uniref:HEAT repeat domain-containing protein n=1 Tax=Halobacterium sp. CBA1126 TaxID=2668074 RepID=UPI0012F9F1CA|nr:HEAT repeat domain-containing protein [Halobacterium sp. CBA1126]MUV59358.1 HEAT repeat domain-containing protein [Halobacterium sp. CBA1126]
MATNSTDPLEGVDPDAVDPGDVDVAEVRAALNASNPLVRQRGVDVCESLAEDDVDAVRPLLDDVAALPDDDNAAVGLSAVSTLDAVAVADPDALDGRLDSLVAAASSDIVDVQLTTAVLFGKLVVERPDLVAPHARALAAAVRDTEPTDESPDLEEFVDHPSTRETIAEHERAERERRISGRQTLVNVVVAVTEEAPESAFDAVDPLAALLDDDNPNIVGPAIDALGELAAADPEAVAPVSDELRECLDHEDPGVRARAVGAIGRLGDVGAVPKLRTLADTDDNEDVRELAGETAAFLTDA